MTQPPAAPGGMDRTTPGMEPRMREDRRMQDAPVAPDERMMRGDTTEQGMDELEADDSMGMGEELDVEEPGGGNQ
jgi:hypothetical protein